MAWAEKGSSPASTMTFFAVAKALSSSPRLFVASSNSFVCFYFSRICSISRISPPSLRRKKKYILYLSHLICLSKGLSCSSVLSFARALFVPVNLVLDVLPEHFTDVSTRVLLVLCFCFSDRLRARALFCHSDPVIYRSSVCTW